MSIIKKIEEISKVEIEEISNATILESEKITNDILESALKNKESLLNKAILSKVSAIQQKKNEFELLEKQNVNSIERDILKNLEKKVLDTLNNYKDKDLLNFVYNLISKEEVSGEEMIQVSKSDYPLYLKALSTKNSDEVVETDLLNKLNKNFSFKLSSKSVQLNSGFLLVGSDYDLNFDFKLLVESVMEISEKEISSKLFN